ncbi:hypothetical protein Tco_0218079, partial [Tanacetum coccineum]
QIYGAVLPECLTSPEMKESKAYKTYLGYATGEVPPKVARKFKKASPSKKKSKLVPGDEKPVKKEKILKTSAKKFASKPTTRIELLSEVALSEKAQMEEVRKKSLRDFHKTHPIGFGTVAEKLPSVEKITPTVTSERTGDKPRVPDVTNDDSSESESESWDLEQDEESDDDYQEEEEFDQESEYEDDEMKNIRQTDAEIVSPLDVHVHHEVPRTQAPTLLTIPVLVIPESSPVFTNIPQSSHTFTPTPIQATPTHLPTIETTNPLSNLPDFSSVFQFNDRITTLEKEVDDLKKDPLHTQLTSLVDSHLDTRLGETREEFMNFLSESLMARIKEQVKDQLPQILPQEVSNFVPLVIEKLIKESRDEVTLAKVSSQPQSTYEAASTLTDFELKKILLDKMEKSEFG